MGGTSATVPDSGFKGAIAQLLSLIVGASSKAPCTIFLGGIEVSNVIDLKYKLSSAVNASNAL